MPEFIHKSVMAAEVLAALKPHPNGRYADGTLGGAGHAASILAASSPTGWLSGCDRDGVALEVARARLNEKFAGRFELRRGFTLKPGERVLMVEDIVTTGLSSREAIEAIQAAGGHVVAAACLIDRSNGQADVGVPLIALAKLDIPSYAPDEVPAALAALPAIKPGSRHLSKVQG